MRVEVLETSFFDSLVAEEIAQSVEDIISEREVCDIALAGGSTPASVYRCLSRPPHSTSVPWAKVNLFLGDERFVPDTDQASNMRMVRETLVSPLQSAGMSVASYPVPTNLSSVAEAADAYDATLRSKLDRGDLDVVLLGMGEDGHFASIFPGSPLVSDRSDRLAAVSLHPITGQERVTITFSAISAARQIYFIVQGAAKAEMLQKVIEGQGSPEEIPCRLFHTLGSKVVWLVDSAAAKLLKKR